MLMLTCLIFFQGFSAIKLTKNGINMIKKGMRKAGKKLIRAVIGCVRDNGMDARLQTMLMEAELPHNFEEIPSNDSADENEDQLSDQQAAVSPRFGGFDNWAAEQNAFNNWSGTTQHAEPSFVNQVFSFNIFSG